MAKTRVSNQVFIQAIVAASSCAEAAQKLGLNEMSVYQRYNKLRKQYPNLPARPVKPQTTTEDLKEFIDSLLSPETPADNTEEKSEVPEDHSGQTPEV